MMAGMGDNSVDAGQLRLFLGRIERLEEEKKGITDDIKEVYAEGKATGYDTKMMRFLIAQRKMEKHHRDEQRMLQEMYLSAIGLL